MASISPHLKVTALAVPQFDLSAVFEVKCHVRMELSLSADAFRVTAAGGEIKVNPKIATGILLQLGTNDLESEKIIYGVSQNNVDYIF